MKLTLNTAATTEPVTLLEAKNHLRVNTDADDNYIETLITGATRQVEIITHRGLINETWDLYLDSFPDTDELVLPLAPLVSVTHVKYTNTGETQTTLSTGDYSVDTDSEPGRIVLDYDASWPSFTPRTNNPINVRFIAGYGTASSVPDGIKQAILLLVSHFYENREPILISRYNTTLPMTINYLLADYRLRTF